MHHIYLQTAEDLISRIRDHEERLLEEVEMRRSTEYKKYGINQDHIKDVGTNVQVGQGYRSRMSSRREHQPLHGSFTRTTKSFLLTFAAAPFQKQIGFPMSLSGINIVFMFALLFCRGVGQGLLPDWSFLVGRGHVPYTPYLERQCGGSPTSLARGEGVCF